MNVYYGGPTCICRGGGGGLRDCEMETLSPMVKFLKNVIVFGYYFLVLNNVRE